MPEPDLFAALEAGDTDTIRAAVAERPERAASRSSAGMSLLMMAVYDHRADLVADLVARLPGLDAFEAAALGRVDLLEDVDPAASAPDGFTPLHLAAFFDRVDTLRHLLDRGADPNARAANPSRVGPLHSAAAARSTACCALLLERGADPDAKQKGGWTALHAACMHGLPELARVLLEGGADPDLVTEDGRPPVELLPDGAEAAAFGFAPG